MTYDNHINPYSTLNIAYPVFFSAANMLGDFDGLNKNNALSLTFTNSVGNSGVTNYQYVYDAEKYPVSATYVNSANPLEPVSIKFEYKK